MGLPYRRLQGGKAPRWRHSRNHRQGRRCHEGQHVPSMPSNTTKGRLGAHTHTHARQDSAVIPTARHSFQLVPHANIEYHVDLKDTATWEVSTSGPTQAIEQPPPECTHRYRRKPQNRMQEMPRTAMESNLDREEKTKLPEQMNMHDRSSWKTTV